MIIKGKEYSINRGTATVTEWDRIYCEILKDTIKNGDFYPNRTGIDTLAIPNVDFDLNVYKNFPILETKKVFLKNTITELLWIYQAQSNDVNWLHQRENHIWDEWMIDADGIYRIYEPNDSSKKDIEVVVKDIYGNPLKDKDGNIIKTKSMNGKTIKSAIYFGEEYKETIGTAYGYVLKKTDQVNRVLQELKNNPRSRRIVFSLRQDDYLKTGVLEPCVWTSSYMLYRDSLYGNVSVRSNDMPIGNPFNVTQYAILLSLLSKVSNLKVGCLHWNITNCHIYVNQLKEINLQLERFDKLCKWEDYIRTHTDEEIEYTYNNLLNSMKLIEEKMSETEKFKSDYQEINNMVSNDILCLEHLLTRETPTLYLANKDNFYDFDNKKENEDIKVLKYTSLPIIKMPVAQ